MDGVFHQPVYNRLTDCRAYAIWRNRSVSALNGRWAIEVLDMAKSVSAFRRPRSAHICFR